MGRPHPARPRRPSRQVPHTYDVAWQIVGCCVGRLPGLRLSCSRPPRQGRLRRRCAIGVRALTRHPLARTWPSRAEALTGAAARSAGLLPQVSGKVPAVTLRQWPRLQRPGLGRPPCRASSRRARSPSRALPAVASLRDGASAALETDLPRQPRHLSGGRERGDADLSKSVYGASSPKFKMGNASRS